MKVGFFILLENIVYDSYMIIASLLALSSLAGHIIGLNLTTLLYTIPIGISIACTTETAR
jgi:hypothetical protein